MNTKTKLTLPNMPSLTDNEQYKTAAAKLADLRADLAKLSARRETVLRELNDSAQNQPRRADAIEAKAYSLLGVNAAGASAGVNASVLREELGTLTDNVQIVTAAVRIQAESVAKLQSEASMRCIAQVLPIHRQLVRDIVERLKELDAALVAENDLIEELRQRDISLGELRVMSLPGIGRLRDVNSRASAYLIECCEFGFLAVNELPKSLQEHGRARTAKPLPAQALAVAGDLEGWAA